MECVSTTTMQISWNGALMEEFRPERGIRQGDPLSPYLFVIGMERLSHTINKAVDEGRWKPLRFSRGGPPISHLFFADDLVLFSRAECSNVKAIKELLDQFSQYSGHRVSTNKTQLYFSPNIDADTAKEIESIFHFKVVDNLGMYLGIPLLHGKVTGVHFRYITDKVQRRLNGWSAASLSMAGRVTLAKVVLSAIPTYCMQVVMLPANVIDEIEKLIQRFVWGGSEQQPKLSLVNWKTVCRPISSGGLGIHDLKTHNQAFMIKLGFRLVSEEKSLWARILREKYKVNSACPTVIKSSSSSFVWRSLSRIWDRVYNSICWSIGDGVRTNFWYDTWIPSLRPLVAHKVNDLPAVVDASVSNMVNHDGEWDWPNFQDLLSHGTCCKIAIICPPAAEAGPDVCTWRWASNGKFSVRGTYDLLSADTITSTEQKWAAAWSFRGPQRVRLFLWLVMHGRLLTNAERCRRHMADDPSCSSCGACEENMEHIFRSCPNAVAVWGSLVPHNKRNRFFSLPFDIWLMENLSDKNKTDDGYWGCLFGLVVWKLWSSGNDIVLQDASFNGSTIIAQCRAWERVVRSNEIKKLTVENRVTKLIQWFAPAPGCWKLNTDGSVKH